MSKKGKKIKSIYTTNKEIKDLLIKQYLKEVNNSTFYGIAATRFKKNGMYNTLKFYEFNNKEEYEHSKKFLKYMISRNVLIISVDLQINFNLPKTPEDILKESLERERENSKSIKEIMNKAVEKEDYDLQEWLQWFIKEQKEEEEKFLKILQQFKLLKDSDQKLFEIDKFVKREIINL